MGWKESQTFLKELKLLTANGMTALGPALKKALDLLNAFRISNGTDNFCQGRNVWFTEPALVWLLTDGTRLCTTAAVQAKLDLNGGDHSQSSILELCSDHYRWDQRLFATVLRFRAIAPPSWSAIIESTNEFVAPLCEQTGGKCYVCHNMKSLLQCAEGIVTRLTPGVVVNFVPSPAGDPLATPFAACKSFIHVRTNSGAWPIPETFLPEENMIQIPARTAQPTVYFSVGVDAAIAENFPTDRYEIEKCALTEQLQAMKPDTTLYLHVQGSNGIASSLGESFGFIKLNNRGVPMLVLLPYNFARLFALLEELRVANNGNPGALWKAEFEKYLVAIPPYYYNGIRLSTSRRVRGIQANVFPEHLDGSLNKGLQKQLNRIKEHARQESERALAMGSVALAGADTPTTAAEARWPALGASTIAAAGAAAVGPSFPTLFRADDPAQETESASDNQGFGLAESAYTATEAFMGCIQRLKLDPRVRSGALPLVRSATQAAVAKKLPAASAAMQKSLAAEGGSMLRQLRRMRMALSAEAVTTQHKPPPSTFRVPISEMGMFYSKLEQHKLTELRDPFEDEKRQRTDIFGNPWVRSRISDDSIDETVDEGMLLRGSAGSACPNPPRCFAQLCCAHSSLRCGADSRSVRARRRLRRPSVPVEARNAEPIAEPLAGLFSLAAAVLAKLVLSPFARIHRRRFDAGIGRKRGGERFRRSARWLPRHAPPIRRCGLQCGGLCEHAWRAVHAER